MPTRPRLSENQRCTVTCKMGRLSHILRGKVAEVLPKGYMVLVDGEQAPEKFSERKVKPERSRRPTAPLSSLKSDPEKSRRSFVVNGWTKPKPIVKPEPPEKCEAWLKYVRTLPCCNCGRGPELAPIEAHHEGEKGVSQKVRDTLAVPLCFYCHKTYTNENALPTSEMTALRTREESLRILQAEQDRLLTAALEKLEQPARIEALSKALARVGARG